MSARQVSVALHPSQFGERDKVVARSGAFVATAFLYPSGVAGLRVDNGAGTVTLLPFQGQQIWDAVFGGRSLTMRSMFDQPYPTREYLRTYGALFLHCGGTSMGNPGPTDTHPLHGELPNLPYTDVQLIFGEDETGAFVDLTGSARDMLDFHHNLVSRPRIRIRENATVLDVDVNVENLGGAPLPFLYLAHINLRPVDGATLIDTVRDDRKDTVFRQPKLRDDEDAAIVAYHRANDADPSSHRSIRAGVTVLPELVVTMKVAADADGWTHALHRHPDGSGDFVSWRADQLPYAVRWMVRGPDKDALGLVLPATAAPDGLAAATAKGQVLWIEPGAAFRTSFRFGAVDAGAATALEQTIRAISPR